MDESNDIIASNKNCEDLLSVTDPSAFNERITKEVYLNEGDALKVLAMSRKYGLIVEDTGTGLSTSKLRILLNKAGISTKKLKKKVDFVKQALDFLEEHGDGVSLPPEDTE